MDLERYSDSEHCFRSRDPRCKLFHRNIQEHNRAERRSCRKKNFESMIVMAIGESLLLSAKLKNRCNKLQKFKTQFRTMFNISLLAVIIKLTLAEFTFLVTSTSIKLIVSHFSAACDGTRAQIASIAIATGGSSSGTISITIRSLAIVTCGICATRVAICFTPPIAAFLVCAKSLV